MGIRSQAGFTILETTLFLAITGLLILMIVAGTGSSLNAQRYRDATQAFKSLVQQQYTDLSSVKNSRDAQWTCDATSTVTPDAVSGELRGQADCLMVGKYMRIENDKISTYTVLARKTSSSIQANDVLSMANNYAMNVSTAEVEERTMDWGTFIAWPASGSGAQSPTSPRNIGILFIRSPDSGLIYTFTSDSIPHKDSIGQATFTNLLVAGGGIPGQGGRTICLGSNGLMTTGDIALYINPFAASSSAIETRSNEILESMGRDTRC